MRSLLRQKHKEEIQHLSSLQLSDKRSNKSVYFLQDDKNSEEDTYVIDFLLFSALTLVYKQEVKKPTIIKHKDRKQHQLMVEFKVTKSQRVRSLFNGNLCLTIDAQNYRTTFQKVTKKIMFPSILWIICNRQQKTIIDEINKITDEWLVSNHNLLVQINEKQESILCNTIKQIFPLQKVILITKYIGFTFNCDKSLTNFQQILNLVKENTKSFECYYLLTKQKTIKYAFQLNNILQVISISNTCRKSKISMEYLTNQQVKQMALLNFNIQASLSEINKKLKQNDLIYFDGLWNSTGQNFKQQLEFICDNWEVYSPFYQKQMQDFRDIISNTISTLKLNHILFPQLENILIRISQVIASKQDNKRFSISKPATINLLSYFRAEILKEKGSANSERLAAIGEKIANSVQYDKDESFGDRWQRIFRKVQNHAKYKEIQRNPSLGHQGDDFLSSLQRQRLPSIDCINCCQFFYEGLNIYSPTINSYPLVLIPAISRVRQLQSQIKDEICWLLNNNGGVILFDCISKYREIIPKGDLMTLQLKSQVEQRLGNFFQNIYPQPDASNYSISFVPIIKNPYQQGRKGTMKTIMQATTYQTTYYQRQYIEGVYVTRIKVNPTVGERLYFWINDEKPIFPKKVNNKIIYTPGREILKNIKKKFNKFYIRQNASNKQQLIFFRPKLSYFHEGDCLRPDLGLQLLKQQRKQKNSLDLQNAYLHMSIVIVRKQHIKKIKHLLDNNKIKCEIECKFDKYQFKYTQNSAVIYHDTRFDLLLNLVSNAREFEFDGRFINVLKITEFIKLTDRNQHNHLPEDDFNNYQNYFSKEYPEEQIRLWKYSYESETEFYLQVATKTQTLFLFYILMQFQERAILKSPKNYDKLTPSQINERFRLFYPRNRERYESIYKSNLKQSRPFKC